MSIFTYKQKKGALNYAFTGCSHIYIALLPGLDSELKILAACHKQVHLSSCYEEITMGYMDHITRSNSTMCVTLSMGCAAKYKTEVAKPCNHNILE